MTRHVSEPGKANMVVSAPARAHVDRQLETELSRMAALVENQLQSAIAAFDRRDVAFARRIIEGDQRIDAHHRDIEARVMELLAASAHPIENVRELMTIAKLAGDLERVGDLAKNVAKRTLVVSEDDTARPRLGVARMGRNSLRQFSDILNAYATRNLEAARAVWEGDDDLDALYNSVFQEILISMMEDPQTINACTHLVFIAKNFERVGDHATNIAEAIFFLATGEPMLEPRPKGDVTSLTRVSPEGASETTKRRAGAEDG